MISSHYLLLMLQSNVSSVVIALGAEIVNNFD